MNTYSYKSVTIAALRLQGFRQGVEHKAVISSLDPNLRDTVDRRGSSMGNRNQIRKPR